MQIECFQYTRNVRNEQCFNNQINVVSLVGQQRLERVGKARGSTFHSRVCFFSLRHCISVLEALLQTLVRFPAVSQPASDWESHRAAHNWPSAVPGLGRRRKSW